MICPNQETGKNIYKSGRVLETDEKKTERETDTETGIQTGRQTGRQTDRDRDGQRQTDTEKQKARKTERGGEGMQRERERMDRQEFSTLAADL